MEITPTTLIFSDTHLTHRPDTRKLNLLLDMLATVDRVIINGDFWDSYLTTAQRFITSPAWQPLFQSLKSKHAIYLYGNHDPEAACSGAEAAFSVEHHHTYRTVFNNQLFHFEHGNRLIPRPDELFPALPRFLLRIGSLADNLMTQIGQYHYLQCYKKWNQQMISRLQAQIAENVYLVCGHSHHAEVLPHRRYANSGSIRGGVGSYLLIRNGVPELQKVTY